MAHVIRVKLIKSSRKRHLCDECDRPINIGESYESEIGINQFSAFYDFKMCTKCLELREVLGAVYEDPGDYMSLQDLAHENSVIEPTEPIAEPKGSNCYIKNHISGVVRDSDGYWVVKKVKSDETTICNSSC